MYLPAVARQQRSKLREVVYLAAVVLAAGQRGIDLIPEDRRPGYYQSAKASVDNSISVSFEAAWERFFNDLDKDQARHYFEQLTPEPFAPYLQPAEFGASSIEVPTRYICCSRDKTFPPSQALVMAASANIGAESIESDHCVMLSHPKELASLLDAGNLQVSGKQDAP
jgi:pimeloyl-ACP methyl ester carboxylesterase